jgi:hypothetical protein
MDEYYDDDFSEKNQKSPKRKSKKLKTNPAGPYELELTFWGIDWYIVIENLTMEDFKVTAKSDKKVGKHYVDTLKRYLKAEGFEMAAKKHNLFW